MLTPNKKIKAFSLLEMVMVIIIIGVLIASISYFKPNNNPENEQKKRWENAAIELFNIIKSAQLEIINNNTQKIWNDILTIKKITIKSEENPWNELSINKQYDENNTIYLKYKYTNGKYINKILWFSNSWNYVTISNNNSFSNDWNFQIQTCNMETEWFCMTISEIYFNKAAQTITQRLCNKLEYNEWKWYRCLIRDKEN